MEPATTAFEYTKEWWPYAANLFSVAYGFLEEHLGGIRLLFFIISLLLLIAVIGMLKKARNEFTSYRRMSFKDLLGFGTKKPVEHLERWFLVEENLESGEKLKVKKAVVEAKHLFDNLLNESGYEGDSFEEKVNSFAKAVKFKIKEDLLESNEIAESLQNNPMKFIDEYEAEEIVKVYWEAVNNLYEVEIK